MDRALRVRPEDLDCHVLEGIVHLKAGNASKALESFRAYRTSGKLKRPSPLYYAYAVLASAMEGDLDYAVAVGREGLGHHPESGPLLVNTGAVL